MRPAELLKSDGTIDQGQTGSPIFDVYTLKGDGVETWRPNFIYHGFQYLQVEGLTSPPTRATVTGIVARAANRPVSRFDTSNQLIDDIHRIIDRAVQGNMYSILTDCPHREKLGWLEETHLVFDAVARNYDIEAYGHDLVREIAGAQLPNGMVTSIAPEYPVFDGGFRDDPNWGSAIVLLPWNLYRTYGDAELLQTYYPNMQRYLDYLSSRATGSLLDYGLGDWGTINANTPAGVTATYGYWKSADALAKVARVVGRAADAARYAELAERIRTAFHAKFFDAARHTYAGGTQAADALALDMGAGPAGERQAVLDHLVANLESNSYHLNLGEIGLAAIFRVLSAEGRDDVVYKIATQTTQPSYGAMLARGATSLTEFWDGSGSQNHFMLGAIDSWFTSNLVGIRQQDDSNGFDELVIDPAVVGDMTHAEGSYETVHGIVRSSWTRTSAGDDAAARGGSHDRARFRLAASIPAGTTATVHVPADRRDEVTESGRSLSKADGLHVIGYEDGELLVRAGSGDYRFEVSAERDHGGGHHHGGR